MRLDHWPLFCMIPHELLLVLFCRRALPAPNAARIPDGANILLMMGLGFGMSRVGLGLHQSYVCKHSIISLVPTT